jgi:cobalamin biosynthesis protein CobD/CbiB
MNAILLGLPDLDRLRELLERIREMLTLGGVALALGVSFVFLLAWVVSHLRKPSTQLSRPILCTAALWSAYVPVLFTAVAAVGALVPPLAPFILKSFALAVVSATLSWCVAIAAILAGGSRGDLGKARRALLLAGTPWYCLAVYLSTFL